jgi:hypothetical protein
MNRHRIVAVMMCLLTVGYASAQEQAPPPPPPPPPAKAATPPPLPPPPPPLSARNVQVDVTVTMSGGATPLKKHMTIVAADGQLALGRSGIEIPVQSRSASESFSYRPVGMNVDARPRILEGNKIGVNLKLSFNTVLKPGENETAGRPSFGNVNSELYLLLEPGKPLVMTQTADTETDRGFTVEVKATILK